MANDNLDDWQDIVPQGSQGNEVDDWQDTTESAPDQPLKEAMFLAKQSSPDQAADAFRLAKKMSLPEDATDYVERNYDQLKKTSEPETDFNKLVSKFPKTSEFLSNPINAKVAQDDIEHMSWIEKAVASQELSIRAQKDVTDTYFPQIVTPLASGVVQAGSGLAKAPFYIYDLINTINAKAENRTPELLPKSYYENPVAKFFDDANKKFMDEMPALTDNWLEQVKEGDLNGASQSIAAQVLQSIPYSIAAGAAFVAGGPLLGVLGMAAPSAAEDYYQNIENKNVSPETNIVTSLGKGLLEGGFEVVGIDAAMGAIAKGMYKGAGKVGIKAVASAALPMLQAFGAEAAEEGLTSISQDLLDYSTGRNPEATKGMFSRAIQAAGIGGLAGVSSPVLWHEGYKRFQEMKQAETTRDMILSLTEEGKKSKLAERLPEKYQEFLQKNFENKNIENVYIDQEDFKTFAQSQNKSPEEIAVQMGISDAFNKASESESPIEMKTAEWAMQATSNPEIFNGLQNDAQYGDTHSVNQAKKAHDNFKADVEAEKKRMDEERATKSQFSKEADTIELNFRDQLIAAGRSKKEASDSAKLMGSFYRAYVGDRAGISPKEFFDRYQFSFEKGTQDAANVEANVTVLNQQQIAQRQNLSPLGFYSQVESEVSKMDFKEMPAQDLFNRIKNIPGVKATELNALGLQDWVNQQQGKVSKEDVLNFIKEKTPVVDQTVLGAGNTSDAFDFSEQKFIPYSAVDSYVFNDAVYFERESYLVDDKEWVEENTADIRADLLDEYTDENGEVDEDGLKSEIQTKLEERAQERAEEYVDSEDYYNAMYVIEERNSGYTLQGNDEIGEWYSSDLREIFSGNAEEAKIKFAQKLIEKGIIEAKTSDLLTADAVEFNEPSGAHPTDATLKKKAKELFSKEKERFIKIAEENYGSSYQDSDKSSEELQKEKEEDALYFAKQEVKESYDDPSNPRNNVTIKIDTSLFDAQLVGNNKKGYTLEIRKDAGSRAKSIKEYKLEGNTTEEAQKSAVEKLLKLGLISKAKDKTGNPINQPSGKTKWSSHTVPGGENYREILIQLPQNPGDKFTYSTHFNEANILAHVRTTDRTDEQGRKVLFLEEVQSDWNQQGREQGYSNEAEAEKIKDRLSQVEQELEQFPNAYVEEGNVEHKKLLDEHRELTQKRIELNEGVPDNPFKQTESWSAVTLKRMLKYAQEMGYEAIAWTPGSVHVKRWGTDSVSWVKKEHGFHIYNETTGAIGRTYSDRESAQEGLKVLENDYAGDKYSIKEGPSWLVGSVEQVGGNADGMNIEEVARQRGQLLERKGVKVTTKDQLKEVILSTLHRERTDRSLESLTDQLWKKMQTEESGVKAPRKEGMEFFYDNVLPKKVAPDVLKKLDKEAKVIVNNIETSDEPLKSWEIVITDKMKDYLAQGQTLFQNGEDENRGQIKIGNNSFSVSLFEKADPTTAIHEFSHASLEMLGDLMEDPKATEEMKGDYSTILNFLGVEKREEIQKAQHEKFADAFETYITEGRAPSERLRSVFHRLKQLFLQVYKWLTSGGGVRDVQLSPEMRRVFDRMLATDAEIARVKPTRLFSDPAAIGMTQAQSDRYIKAEDEARAYAEDLLRTKIAAAEKKRQRGKYKEMEASIQKGWMKTTESMPIYQLLSVIREEKMINGADMPEALQDLKIDQEALVKMFGKDILKTLPKDVYANNATGPQFIADSFGFESVTQMVDLLATSLSREEFVAKKTKEDLEKLFPDPMANILPEDALRAKYNEKLAEMRQIELEHMATNNLGTLKDVIKKVTRRPPKKEYVKEQAMSILAKEKVININKSVYDRQARNSAKEAGNALTKGDLKAAFDWKSKEQLFGYMYLLTENVERTKEQLQTLTDKFNQKADNIKGRNHSIVAAGQSVLSYYGEYKFEGEPSDQLSYLKEYDEDTYNNILETTEIAKVPGKRNIQELTYQELLNLKESLAGIWQVAKEDFTITKEGEKLSKANIILEMTNTLEEMIEKNNIPTEALDYSKKNRFGVFKDNVLSLLAHAKRVENFFMSLTPDKYGNVFTKYITDYAHDAIAAQRIAEEKILKELEEIFATKGNIFVTDKLTQIDEIGGSLTPTQVLGMILHSGNDSNIDKLVRGWRWNNFYDAKTQVSDPNAWRDAIMSMMKRGVITKDHMDLIQAIWDKFENIKRELQVAHKEMYGYYFDEVTSNEIKTPWVDENGKPIVYKGGYAPAIYDPNKSASINEKDLKAALEKQSYADYFPTTGKGATLRRVQKFAAPLVLDLNFVPLHFKWATRFIHVEPVVKNIAKILRNKDITAKLDIIDPNILRNSILPWIQRVATQRMYERSKIGVIDDVANFSRSATSIRFLAFNVRGAVTQFLGVFLAAGKIKPKYLFSTMASFANRPIETYKLMAEMSPYMKNVEDAQFHEIKGNIEKIVRDETLWAKAGDVNEFVNKIGFYLFGFFQDKVNRFTWNAAFNEYIGENKNSKTEDAVKYADRIVRETQGFKTPEGVSNLEAGSPMWSLAMQFLTYSNMHGNLMYFETKRLLSEEVPVLKKSARLAYLWGTAFIIANALQKALYTSLGGGWKDDDDDFADQLFDTVIMSQIEEFLSIVPGGNIVNAAFQRATGKGSDNKINFSAANDVVSTAIVAPIRLAKKGLSQFSDIHEELNEKDFQDFMDALGFYTKTPMSALGKRARYLYKASEGKLKVEDTPLEILRGTMTGVERRPNK